jgi:hypothetical protein
MLSGGQLFPVLAENLECHDQKGRTDHEARNDAAASRDRP